MANPLVVIRGSAGDDLITLSPNQWAVAGNGHDTIVGNGYGTFGVRFDDSRGGYLAWLLTVSEIVTNFME
jgi:hypothetical protein